MCNLARFLIHARKKTGAVMSGASRLSVGLETLESRKRRESHSFRVPSGSDNSFRSITDNSFTRQNNPLSRLHNFRSISRVFVGENSGNNSKSRRFVQSEWIFPVEMEDDKQQVKQDKRVESLGWLTESSVMPKKQKLIAGVGASSILELKAQLYKTQEESRKAKDLAPEIEYHRAKKRIGQGDVFSRKNSGVDGREKRDKLALKAEEDGSASYAALEKKAQLYDKLARGELSDEEEKDYCVDFFQKSVMNESEQPESNSQVGVSADKEDTAKDSDMIPGLFSRSAAGPGRTGVTLDKDEHKRFVKEVHEEASQARETASALKLRRQAQALAQRERLKQAYLRKQVEKLRAVKQEEMQHGGSSS